MIRLFSLFACLIVFSATPGCGDSPQLDTSPLTEEQKRQIKEADRQVDEEEQSGSGSASPRKKRR